MNTSFQIALLFFLLLISCVPKKQTFIPVKELINTDSLKTAIIHFVKGSKIQKTVKLDSTIDNTILSADSITWKKELELIDKFNTKLPSYAGSLLFVERGDTLFCLPKENEISAIKKCWVVRDSLKNVRQIFGHFIDNRAEEIYLTEQEISLSFANGEFVQLIVKGYQKMMLKDTVYYEVTLSPYYE